MKICCKCKVPLDESQFHKNHIDCKMCRKQQSADYYIKNKYKISEKHKKYYKKNEEKILIKCKEYHIENKEKIKEKRKLQYKENKEKIKEKHKKYYENNKEKSLNRSKQYYKNNKEKHKGWCNEWIINNKERWDEIRRNWTSKDRKEKTYKYIWRDLLNRLVKNSKCQKKGLSTLSLLGYSALDLKINIETKFQENMTWDNYGIEWEIHHKKPLKDFKENVPPSIVNALDNLQPLWKEDHKKIHNNGSF